MANEIKITKSQLQEIVNDTIEELLNENAATNIVTHLSNIKNGVKTIKTGLKPGTRKIVKSFKEAYKNVLKDGKEILKNQYGGYEKYLEHLKIDTKLGKVAVRGQLIERVKFLSKDTMAELIKSKNTKLMTEIRNLDGDPANFLDKAGKLTDDGEKFFAKHGDDLLKKSEELRSAVAKKEPELIAALNKSNKAVKWGIVKKVAVPAAIGVGSAYYSGVRPSIATQKRMENFENGQNFGGANSPYKNGPWFKNNWKATPKADGSGYEFTKK